MPYADSVPSGDVEVLVLPSGLQVVKLPNGDEIWALPRPTGLWVTARAKVRIRVGRPYTFAVRRCHPGYHRSLDAAVRCAKKKLPELHDQADALRKARAPGDREALGRIRKRRNERVGPGWQKIRRQVLSEEPVCPCGAPSTEVDHIIPAVPVRGGTSERDNLQALCRACHIEKTARDFPSLKTR
jgi:5-methylcytosine-specific restriction protein A